METKQKIKALIVDDEALARMNLCTLLQKIESIEIAGEAENGFEALRAVIDLKPDLLFLDVQMPQLDGFDLVEMLAENCPVIIFVTAFDQYALRAFENNAIDYLLKPVNYERLQAAIEKALQLIIGRRRIEQLQSMLEAHRLQQAPLKRILVRSGSEIIVLQVKEISHFQAEDDYVRIFSGAKSYLKCERLNRLEKLLDSRKFCRVHRSFIINLQYLKTIESLSAESRIARLSNGAVVPISRDGYQRLKKLF